jgi:hypothetical protein
MRASVVDDAYPVRMKGLVMSRTAMLAWIRRLFGRPTRRDILDRIHARPIVKLRTSAAEVIRAERDNH